MMNCAELCQVAGNFLLTQSPLHGAVCGACAEVCNACAQSCEEVGDMDECVKVCRDCADSCEQMATSAGLKGAASNKTKRAGADRH